MRDFIGAVAIVAFAAGWYVLMRRTVRDIARDAFALWDLRQERRRRP